MHQTSWPALPAGIFNRLLNHFWIRILLLFALSLLAYAVLATLTGCRKGPGETRTTSFVYSFQLMTHRDPGNGLCWNALQAGPTADPWKHLRAAFKCFSACQEKQRTCKDPKITPLNHSSETAVPPSVHAMYIQLRLLGMGNCLSTDTVMFPGQWHINMEISKTQELKAHQYNSLKSHCCELLSHPRKAPTALPNWWLRPPNNFCHPIEFSSGCACPCLYGQTSQLLLLQRCISWYNRSWPDKIPALLFNSALLCGKWLYLCHTTDLLYWSFFLLVIAQVLKLTGEHLLLLSLSSGADRGNISPCLQLAPGREGSLWQA